MTDIGNLFYFRRPAGPGNFGDELSTHLVAAILKKRGIRPPWLANNRLLAVGSILHFADNGDTVWGSGVNGKIDPGRHGFTRLDVRSVRGPLTRTFLRTRGVSVPEVYGDPALLTADFFPMAADRRHPKHDYIVVPNYNDLSLFSGTANLVSPLLPVHEMIDAIVSSRFVMASALHAVIVAESYGIPSRLVLPPGHTEPLFKYQDYYEGTGRSGFEPAGSIEEALDLGGEPAPGPNRDMILEAFPLDLFTQEMQVSTSLSAAARIDSTKDLGPDDIPIGPLSARRVDDAFR